VVLVFVIFVAKTIAEDKQETLTNSVSEEDKEWLKGLLKKSQEIAMSNTLSKYNELLAMQNQQGLGLGENRNLTDLEEESNDFENSVSFKVFVSSSMGKVLLKAYVEEAKRYGGILVFNGLPDNSWVSLNKMVMEIIEDKEEVAMQIDPEEFDRFNIKMVPAFVLVKEGNWLSDLDHTGNRIVYDKVTGNISIGAALRLFAEQGELQSDAKIKLENGKND
jgi:type-F conjugative transfer system pilin assembly protein TrbC